ncbi:Flp pilus assembly protein CpaB [uncultured Castellaniella sp.]|uniref:Flp pilus assembly protein CpaB n=1 Tax=uncultured Castellaniella sp. TaxID=647907 RepID=UPI00262459A4|nr:Flp pilus assembly protein CpaB [uncultured Castellaniella sp.]
MSAVLRFSLILLAAGILALVARALFVSSQAPAPAPHPDQQVRIAAADLPAGLLLRESDLSWKTVRPEAIPKGAIVQGSPIAAKLAGAMLRNPLAAGATVLAGNIIQPDAPGFLAAALAPGMRAVSVPVDDVSGNAGLIQPGDRVDMILTQKVQRGSQRATVSETVVENVRIIAVGSTFTPPRDANGAGNVNRARTITAEVSPPVAEAVTVASHLGTLSLALRSFATTDRNGASTQTAATVVAQSDDAKGTRPTWGGDVSRALAGLSDGPPPPPPSSGVAPKRSITLLRGAEKQELAF